MPFRRLVNAAVFAFSGAAVATDLSIALSPPGRERPTTILLSAITSAVAYTALADLLSQQLLALAPNNSWAILTWVIEGAIVGGHMSPLLSAFCARRALNSQQTSADIIRAIRADSVWKDVEGWHLLIFGPLVGAAAAVAYWALLYLPMTVLYGLFANQ
eukprot:TRINITY_DN428_c1_g2_i1.p2 TRINITY_DN428_c1_g2~~TRINITY_DN428_c1_g2_i1.p2  ORF type:complete len:159 (+),score=11.60 TRINITY_DN428_c1_g2_i1:107-583(+)